MIPADSFLLSDDGTTALVVFGGVPGWTPIGWEALFNRPCVVCKGLGRDIADLVTPCPDCIDGRHTFDIEVEADYFLGPMHHHVLAEVHRVHVLDVMPIIDVPDTGYPHPKPEQFAYVSKAGSLRVVNCSAQTDTYIGKPPPDAAPGQWLVRLAVHQ